MDWFDHSSSAASDDAIMALRMEHPDSAAVDCYWGIVEKQFHDERSVPFSETDRETKALAYRLFVGFDVLEKYVKTMLELGLLKKDDNGMLYSERAKKAIEAYQKKCETARQNGKRGGRKANEKPTQKPTAKPTQKPTEKPPCPKQNNTGIGLDKLNQYQCADAAAEADGSAPPSASKPVCPLCRTAVRYDVRGSTWECPNCGPIKGPEYAEWGAA